jgi:hypothetical protein
MIASEAIMSFTRWLIEGKEKTVLKIKPEAGSKIQLKLPDKAMYVTARSDSIAFLYNDHGYLIFYT